MKIKITKLVTLFLACMVYGANLHAATYYSKGSLAANDVVNWSLTTDGTGDSPADFVTAADVFIIQNGHSMTTSQHGLWVLQPVVENYR
jgi:hypothetical protein